VPSSRIFKKTFAMPEIDPDLVEKFMRAAGVHETFWVETPMPKLKRYIISLGVPADDVNACETKDELLRVIEKYAVFENGVLVIQGAVAGVAVRKQVKEEIAKQENASDVIKASMAGNDVRQELAEKATAAQKIQAGITMNDSRRQTEAQMDAEDAATVQIQAVVSGAEVRQDFANKDEAAKKIQAGMAGSDMRGQVPEMREAADAQDAAASQIQAGIAGAEVRQSGLEHEKELARNQAERDAALAKMSDQERAALQIQAGLAGTDARNTTGTVLSHMDKSAAPIQASVVGAEVRQSMAEKESAALQIQGGIAGTEVRQDMASKEEAAAIIQAGIKVGEAKETVANMEGAESAIAKAKQYLQEEKAGELSDMSFADLKTHIKKSGVPLEDVEACKDKKELRALAAKFHLEQILVASGEVKGKVVTGDADVTHEDGVKKGEEYYEEQAGCEEIEVEWSCMCLLITSASEEKATFKLVASNGTAKIHKRGPNPYQGTYMDSKEFLSESSVCESTNLFEGTFEASSASSDTPKIRCCSNKVTPDGEAARACEAYFVAIESKYPVGMSIAGEAIPGGILLPQDDLKIPAALGTDWEKIGLGSLLAEAEAVPPADSLFEGEDALDMHAIFKHKLWTGITLKEADSQEPLETAHIGSSTNLVVRQAGETVEIRNNLSTKYSRSRAPMQTKPISPLREVMGPKRSYSTTLSPGDKKTGFTMNFRNQGLFTRRTSK